MPDTTITRKGRYVVRSSKGGAEISQHNVEREAIEAALNAGGGWIDYPEGMEVIRGGVSALTLTSVGGAGSWGATISTTNIPSEDDPVKANARYTDGTDWAPSSIPSEFLGVDQLVTDNAGAGGSFTINVASEVYVAIRDAATQPAWLSTFTDTGHDLEGGTRSIHVAPYAAGVVTLSSASEAYDVFVIAGPQRVSAVPTAGSIRFVADSYPVDDDGADVSGFVERYDGAAGAATVTLSSSDTYGVLNANGGDLSSDVASWANGESGTKEFTYNPSLQTADQVEAITLGTFVGASEGSLSTCNILITDTGGGSPPAQEWFVAPSAAGSGDGTTELNAAQASTFCNSIQPHASGHVVVWWIGDSGDYRNYVYTPTYSGTDATHAIQHKPLNSDVQIKGPASGSINYAMIIAKDHIHILRDSGFQLHINGEGTAVKNGGVTGSHIKYIANFIGADNCIFEFKCSGTQGWGGLIYNGDNNIYRLETGQHGNPYQTSSTDNGDSLEVEQLMTQSYTTLFEGFDDNISGTHPGHSKNAIQAGGGIVRHNGWSGDWSDVAGYSAGEGQRSFGEIRRNAKYYVVDDEILCNSGKAADGGKTELAKWEGDSNTYTRSFFFGGISVGLKTEAAGWSFRAQNLRAAHLTFYDLADPAWWGYDYSTSQYSYTHFDDIRIYNCILEDVANNPTSGSLDCAFYVRWADTHTDPWSDHIFIKNCIIPSNMTTKFINITNDGPGLLSLADAEASYPANFSGNIVGDAGLSAPATNSDFSNVYTRFAPSALAANAGTDLTTTNGSGSSSTTLIVHDSLWFATPSGFPAPAAGPDAGAYIVNVAGANLAYTALDQATKTFTLASPASWANGAAINLSHTGASPDIGAVQS